MVLERRETSVGLEEPFCRELKDIAPKRRVSVSHPVRSYNAARGNPSSPIRLFVLSRYRGPGSTTRAANRYILKWDLWVSTMIFAAQRSMSPKRGALCNARRVSLSVYELRASIHGMPTEYFGCWNRTCGVDARSVSMGADPEESS